MEKTFFERYEFLIPFLLFVFFLAFTLPGISWGAPNTWHPDEIVIRSINALFDPEYRFDEINFDYPTLPQYVMYGLGKVVLGLGYSEKEILISARVLSAILAGLTILLTYLITRRISGNIYIAGLSGLLLACVPEMPHNGRFAHNDTFITFFVTLAVLCLVQYKVSYQRAWLYASFFAVGLAASSKYNGISLVIAPVITYIASRRQAWFRLRTLEVLSIGGALTFGGYVVGTSQALTSMTFYFKRMIPALLHTGNYMRRPDSVRGYVGQYASFAEGVGLFLFVLFSAAFAWACYKVYQAYLVKHEKPERKIGAVAILLLSIVALDIPILISYNYPARFFLSMMPAFAVLGALFLAELYRFERYRLALNIMLALVVLYSTARHISMLMLFLHDARIPASQYLETLPTGTSLEHTYYPPSIPLGHFEREHNYPIYFVKGNEPLPASRQYEFNDGEIGLDERETDYLVTDSFTYERFNDPYICTSMQTECDFFKQLDTGQSNHYKLIAEFSYTLPSYLPQNQVLFVNPTIRVYGRLP